MISKVPAASIPNSPGSYQFKDELGRVIYVGKAANLRSRVGSYFADPKTLHPRTASMVADAHSVEWIVVRSELEALILEFTLVKEHHPRYNIRLRDDKSYPFMAVTVGQQWPRALVVRNRKKNGTRYFGPYVNAWAIRETFDLILRTFPVRTCSDSKFTQHEKLGRPCLLFHIEKCSGPCVGAVSASDYDKHVREFMAFLGGESEEVVQRMQAEMGVASDSRDYERAAVLRDRITAVHKALEKQQMVGERSEDIDLIGVAEDDLEASVQVFHIRKGRVVGRNGFIVDRVEHVTSSGLIDRILEQFYGEEPALGYPKEVLVPILPDNPATYEEFLSQRRKSAVQIRVPQRGDKRALLETVTKNAQTELNRHRMKRSSDHNSRSRALTQLQTLLGLPKAPLRIECYDMAHLHGTDYVGSMVVLEDGLPNKREYRRFKVKTVAGNDDYAAMREVLTRRLSAFVASRDKPVGEPGQKPGRFAYPPQLLLVDGGKGQLSVAVEVLAELGLTEQIPVAALAKRFEEVFVPGSASPIEIARGDDALYMLQVIRDEAHRFANSFHRQLRGKKMRSGLLDNIAGLGEARSKRLSAALGGVAGVKAASREDLRLLTWLPDVVADAVFERCQAKGVAVSLLDKQG
jgi:excinuclease ABC subunit C